MSILSFLTGRKFAVTDFKKWAENHTEKQLEKLCKKISDAGKEFDFTKMCWGHAVYMTKEYPPYILYCHGFYGKILGLKAPEVGSILLMKTQSGKTGKYLILNIEWERNPDDMFWAYIVGVGYKEENKHE